MSKFRVMFNFICRRCFLILWLILLILLFCKMFRYYNKEPEYAYLRKMLGIYLCISRGTVPLIYLMVSLIMFPVCKTFNQIMHRLLNGISKKFFALYIENAKMIHITLSSGLLLVSIIHSCAHVVNACNYIRNYSNEYPDLNWASGKNDHLYRLLFLTSTGASGLGMLVILIALWICSRRFIRNCSYRTFIATHHLFIVFLLLIYVHASGNIIKYQLNVDRNIPNNKVTAEFNAGVRYGWICPTTAISIYILDQIYRFIKRNQVQVTVLEAVPFPGRAVFLRFQLDKHKLNIKPCDYILLNCPEISKIEWHPFTVTKCPSVDDSSITVLIRARGDWTESLFLKVQNSRKADPEKCDLLDETKHSLEFLIDGPFPSPFGDYKNYKTLVFIAAGVGITPFVSILNEIRAHGKTSHRMHLVWVIRYFEQFLWCSRLLHTVLDEFWDLNTPDRLQLQIYVTRKGNYGKDDLNSMSDFLTFSHRIYFSRPDWTNLFNNLTLLHGKKTLGVFCSGPKILTNCIRNHCNNLNDNGFHFQFIHEGFN